MDGYESKMKHRIVKHIYMLSEIVTFICLLKVESENLPELIFELLMLVHDLESKRVRELAGSDCEKRN